MVRGSIGKLVAGSLALARRWQKQQLRRLNVHEYQVLIRCSCVTWWHFLSDALFLCFLFFDPKNMAKKDLIVLCNACNMGRMIVFYNFIRLDWYWIHKFCLRISVVWSSRSLLALFCFFQDIIFYCNLDLSTRIRCFMFLFFFVFFSFKIILDSLF